MKLETIKKLCCPFDKAEIALTTITKDVSGNILEGFLTCEDCKRIYPIVKGVPIMSPDEYREPQLETPLIEQWSAHYKGKALKDFRLVDNTPAIG